MRSVAEATEIETTGRSRLGDLYLSHADGALRLAFLLTGDRALADDLVQDAFVYLAGRLAHLRDPNAFDAYLRRTVVNLANTHFRRRKVERTYLESRARDPAARRVDPDIPLLQTLRSALLRLPHRQRLAVGSVAGFRALIAEGDRRRLVPATDPTLAIGKIAFSSYEGGIHLVDNGGGSPVRLTPGTFPSFSPDGTGIAFVRNGQIHVMRADGTGNPRLIDRARAQGGLAWSPDGTRIAFIGSDTTDGTLDEGLFLVASDGTGISKLTDRARPEDSTPSWSPDGSRILVGTGEGFLLIDVQSGETSVLTRDRRMAGDQRHCGSYFGPAFSPDGSTIAFARWRAGG